MLVLGDIGELLNLLINIWATGAATLSEYLTGRKNETDKIETYRRGLIRGTILFFIIPTSFLVLSVMFNFGIPLTAILWAIFAIVFLILWTPIGIAVELVFTQKIKDKYLNFCVSFIFWGLATSMLLVIFPYENNPKMIPLFLLALAVLILYGITSKKKFEMKKIIASLAMAVIVFVLLSFISPPTMEHITAGVGGLKDKDVFNSSISPTPSNVIVQQHQESVVEQQKYKETIFLKSGEIWVSEKVFKAGDVICIKTDNECLYLDSSDNGYVVKKSISGTKYITKTRDGAISFLSSTPTRIEISQYN